VTRAEGSFDPAFRAVADCFADSLDAGERGAVAIRIGGRTVVDLRGGRIDPDEPGDWRHDTIACVFSVTKGIVSLLAHRLIDQGMLEIDAPVVRYWPEFAAGGKQATTVRDALTHRAGLPAVSVPVRRGDLYDWDRMVRLIEASEPVVPPRAAPVYHNMTYGHLVGEILCRAAGLRPLSALLERELLAPLGADFRLGLGASDFARVARMASGDPRELFRAVEDDPASLFARSMLFFASDEDFNTARWRMAQIGSGSGHATALGVARLYEQYVAPDALIGTARQHAARSPQAESAGADPVLGVPIRYGEGVELSLPPGIDFGPRADSLGHWGAGGATGFADPQAGLAFGYVTAEMATGLGSSPRARALIAALYESL